MQELLELVERGRRATVIPELLAFLQYILERRGQSREVSWLVVGELIVEFLPDQGVGSQDQRNFVKFREVLDASIVNSQMLRYSRATKKA